MTQTFRDCLPKLSALKTLVVENVNQQFSKYLPRLPQLRRLVIFPGYMSKMTLPLRLPKRMVKLELMELGFYEIFIRDISKCMMEGDYARLSLHFREQRSILLKYSYRNVSSLR